MGILFSKLSISNTTVKNELLRLDGHVILSKGKYDYRFNILDLHHKIHPSTIKRDNGQILPHNKEWAFGHIIVKNGDVYFSERPTDNKDVEKHPISRTIYSAMNSNTIYDIDRNAKKIDAPNIKLIVNIILTLRKQGLIS